MRAWISNASSEGLLAQKARAVHWLKPLTFTLCLLPFVLLLFAAFSDALGANPVEKITHRTGDWTLRLLLLTLSITPLRRLSGWHELLRIRRMLGLFTFFYACLHFLTYLVFDQFFDLQEIYKDIVKRPYITLGFSAYLLLIPLAVTSSKAMIKRLGRRWRQLHQLVYVIATLGVLHYLWLVKKDLREPLIYAVILLLLLAWRVWARRAGPHRT